MRLATLVCVVSIRCERRTGSGRRCLRRIDAATRTGDCGRHGRLRSPHTGWTPSLLLDLEPGERPPAHALRRAPAPAVPDAVRDLGRRICTDRWQAAVAWRLSGALDEAGWSALRRRPTGLCRPLAAAAREIEQACALHGDAAGLATLDGLRWFRRTRLVQKVAQAAVMKAVPAAGEYRSRAVAHCLLVTGVWLCVGDGDALRDCRCFQTLAGGRTADRVRGALDRHLTCLRASAPGG